MFFCVCKLSLLLGVSVTVFGLVSVQYLGLLYVLMSFMYLSMCVYCTVCLKVTGFVFGKLSQLNRSF